MGKRSSSYHDYLIKRLKDPKRMEGYINAALEDGDPKILLSVLEDCAEAKGGITWLSRETRLTRPALYKLLSDKGNPKYDSLAKVLTAFGLRLGVFTLHKPKKGGLVHA